MFKIRKEQYELLGLAMASRFEDNMVEHLAEILPDKVEKLESEGDGVRLLVRKGIKKGGSYNIVTERDVCVLIELMTEFGEGFELQPGNMWARRLLEHPEKSAQTKMQLLHLRLKGLPRED